VVKIKYLFQNKQTPSPLERVGVRQKIEYDENKNK